MKKLALMLAVAGLAACQADTPPAETTADVAADVPSPAAAMNDIADRYYAWTLERFPEQAYFAAVELDRHDGLLDNSPGALAAAQAVEDELLAAVAGILLARDAAIEVPIGDYVKARLEEIAVLEWAIAQDGHDPRAPYYLGCLLYDRRDACS